MFNKYTRNDTYVSYGGPSKIDVTEKKAPTDESIRLLNEMQEKAFDNIVECVQLNNNDLNDITYWIYPDQYSFEERVRVRFKLNGRVVDFSFQLPNRYSDKAEVLNSIRSKIIEKISEQLLKEFVDKNISTLKDLYSK